MSYTKQLADYAVKLQYQDLPKDVVEQAKLLTLHTLGVGLAACPTEQGKKAIALAKDMGGQKEEATILGDGSKVPCVQAAFANGALADILDWEDCSWTGHPSACVIPTALALGERIGASGKDFITSVVTAYEVYERIAMAVQPSEKWDHLKKGWGIYSWAIYAAAIPAAKLLQLNNEQMENLIAIAGMFTPISTNTKMHFALSNQYHYMWGMLCNNGIAAALMAERGIDPIPDYLDGENGYWIALSDKCDWEWFNKGFGKDYLIMETYFKHWPTNMWINQPLDGIDAIRRNHQIKAEDVEQIIVRPPVQNRTAYRPEGYNVMNAEFSIPYLMAVYLLDHDPGPNWYAKDKLKDPTLLELAGKVKMEGPELKLNDAFLLFRAGKYPNMSVEVKTKDGRTFKQDVPFPKGHPKNRMTIDEFKDRFRRAASFALKTDRAEKAINGILKLEGVENISQISELLHN